MVCSQIHAPATLPN